MTPFHTLLNADGPPVDAEEIVPAPPVVGHAANLARRHPLINAAYRRGRCPAAVRVDLACARRGWRWGRDGAVLLLLALPFALATLRTDAQRVTPVDRPDHGG